MSGAGNARIELTGALVTDTYDSLAPVGSVTPQEEGVIVYDDEAPDIAYALMKWLGAAVTAVGDVVFIDYANGVATQANQLGTGTTGLDSMAGIARGITTATKVWFWCQIKGLYSAIKGKGDSANIALGDSLKGVSGQRHVVQDVAIGTTPSYQNYMRALEAFTAASSYALLAYINCLNR